MYEDGRRSSSGGRLLIAVVIAVISLVSYYGKSVYNPVTNEKQHLDLSPSQEIALGLRAAPEMAAQYGGLDPDPRDQELVLRVGGYVVAHSDAAKTPYQYAFHALRDPRTINAFALPGGQVFITSGLLHRLKTEGQLAGVLGHEVGHVAVRDSAQQLAKQQLTQGLSGAAVIAASDPDNPHSRQSAAVAMAIGQLVNLRFGRQDELQADRLGVRFMAQSGYDPRAMLDVMRILAEASQGHSPPEFFSTHPNPENRMARIKEAIDEQFPQGVPEGLKK